MHLAAVIVTDSGRPVAAMGAVQATPLPALVSEVEMLSVRVGAHLKKMGFAWT